MFRRLLTFLCWVLLLLVLQGTGAWAVGAVWFDAPFGRWNKIPALLLALGLGGILWRVRPLGKLLGVWLLLFASVLLVWRTQVPRLDRVWQADVGQLPWAEIKGDEVTLYNIRNFDYRTETDFTPHWETRTVRLSQLTGVDMFINYWGSPWMAHPIVSFQFADAPPVCFSIETRKETGESYSSIGGLYRQYELIYIAADEGDVIRLRTNYRKGEDSYLYRINIQPEGARGRFMEYVNTINSLRERPRWYNAITTNCTTAIRSQHPSGGRLPWDWRILVNGKGDELLFEQQAILTGGLTFPELRTRALINAAARTADQSLDFSRLIRAGRPGFSTAVPIFPFAAP